MTDSNDDYVYDEATGEWVSAAEAAARADVSVNDNVEVRDAVGVHVIQLRCYGAGTSQPTPDVLRAIAVGLARSFVRPLLTTLPASSRSVYTPPLAAALSPAAFAATPVATTDTTRTGSLPSR